MHICVLLYGDYPLLARRCLDSIARQISRESGYAVTLKICMNSVGQETRTFVNEFHHKLKRDAPNVRSIFMVESDKNVGKYPMMRFLFAQPVWNQDVDRPDAVMWFDDDSFIDQATMHFFQMAAEALCGSVAQCGKLYRSLKPYTAQQLSAIQQQEWFQKGDPGNWAKMTECPTFATGGWWVASLRALRALGFPWPELDHRCGGDILLSLALKYRDYKVIPWNTVGSDAEVRVNAGGSGVDSTSTPRGRSTQVELVWSTPTSVRQPVDVELTTYLWVRDSSPEGVHLREVVHTRI